MEPSQNQAIYAAATAVLACVACVFDLRSSRIPNRFTVPALVVGIAAHAWPSSWKGMTDAVAAALLAGSVCLLFYLAGGMGAGDVKLMAATASFVGLSSTGILLISTGLAGALFAIGVSAARGVLRRSLVNAFAVVAHHGSNGLVHHPELNVRNSGTIRLPYAVPIAAGCLFTLAKQMVQR